ncbi:hypothetical protein [Streptomyces sp. NBC_01803]|uniref:hypothetical protein n=1 Tax=Streptomyces sp. NBC_01803 TaxID=2975946 RepID=UPI002DDC5037|nr:hypothetical protein [Streptomyces sp. NBC_01803]WSA46974.1 hypothetical protein OIE51_24015 [Streptomyces sp. NBC_01803]
MDAKRSTARAVSPPFPAWIPSGHLAQPRPCGLAWDAVITTYIDGIRALGHLGLASRACMQDPEADLVAWLVKPGSAEGWDLPGVRVLGRGEHIDVPPAEPLDTATLQWAIEPDPEDYWTCPRQLHRAVATVAGVKPDPRVLSTFTSLECLTGECERCTKGEVAATPPDTGVVEEPCAHLCHRWGATR